ncbi:MAG: type II 3-dehydroquinate dehydratase [Bacteroidia bacterium]|jgi:3-dehydroquinate dehydratase II
MKIGIINGPNLNLLGSREPHIYGTQTWDTFFNALKQRFHHIELTCFQSNIEGELVDAIQQSQQFDAGIINPGAYAHTSLAIADALAAISVPFIEVHLSNIFSREAARHVLYSAGKCKGTISGLGLEGYVLAIQYWEQHGV